jgi:ABC-2 type transport system ATP-binding protein
MAAAAPPVMIRAEGLSRSFGATRAVDGLDLSIDAGCCFGLLGANGSGKSTTIQLLATLLLPSAGTATVAGHRTDREPVKVRAAIGMVFQDAALDRALSVDDNLRFAGALCGLPPAAVAARSGELLALFEIAEKRDQAVATLSGGQRRAVDIARALLHRPAVLLLDEPTTGLDPVNRRTLWTFLRRLCREQGTTLLVSTHLLDEAGDCDRVLFMARGRALGGGRPHELIARAGAHVLELTGDEEATSAFAGLGPGRRDGPVYRVRIHDPAFTINQLDAQALARLSAVTLRRPRLEDVYLDLHHQAGR